MLSELQKRKLTALFHHQDTNGDGFLEKADYERYMEKFAQVQNFAPDSPRYQAVYGQTMAAWEQTQKIADQDGDGRASLDEFLASWDITLGDEKLFEQLAIGYYRSLLDMWDRDGDGRLSGVEYIAFLGCYGVPEEAAREAFRHLDRKANGYLSAEELLQAAREFLGSDPDAPGNWIAGPY